MNVFFHSFHVMMFNNKRLACALIIVMQCIKLNDQSLQCTFLIINGTKYSLRKCIFCCYKVVENESERAVNTKVL